VALGGPEATGHNGVPVDVLIVYFLTSTVYNTTDSCEPETQYWHYRWPLGQIGWRLWRWSEQIYKYQK